MKRVFNREIVRSISGSWGRFLAIAGIVALGCGFYAGLRMTGPDMRIAADAFYDGTSLYDVRMLSTLGYTDEQVGMIDNVEGVEAVMPARSTDVMASLGGEQYAMRINTLKADSAAASSCTDGCRVASGDDGYLNRLVLATGSWPTQPGECVLSADRVMGTPIQVGDTVQVLYGSGDLDGVLETRTFTVVGTAHSSAYVSSITLGATSLGTGSIQQFAYVTDDSFAPDCPYTEVYVKVAGAADEFSGGAVYQATVDDTVQRLKDRTDDLANSRVDQLKADAQAKLDDQSGVAQAQIDDAWAQLDDAKAQLDDALDTLESSQAQVDDGWAQVQSGQAQLDDARVQLEQGRSEYAAAAAEWKVKRAELEDQLASVQSKLSEAQKGKADAEATLAQLQGQQKQVQQAIAALDPASAGYAQQLAALQAQLAQVQTGITKVQDGIAQAQAGIVQAQSGIAKLQAGIASGDAQISAARQKLDDAAAELASNQATIDQTKAQLQSSQQQIYEGRAEYEANLQTYEAGHADATTRAADAATVIANAQKDIDGLAAPDIYVLDRTKNYGVSSLKSDSERIDNIAAVFPFIFFLVAALVALTTMTRMVDEERVLIGTYKALGYGRAVITWKYLVYAGIASISGAFIGIAALSQVLPFIISRAYAIIYNVPQPPLPLAVDMPLALLAAGMGVGITLFSTWAAVAATLREQPASLMLPRAPRAGKRILMERITPLWRRMGFSWKVTCRNLFRYKKRLFMTVVGIAGCTALLLTGLGLHNAIWDIIDKQYGELVHYNVIVTLKDDATDDDVRAIESFMADSGCAWDMTRTQDANMQVRGNTDTTYGVEEVVPQDADAFSRVYVFRERLTRTAITMDDDAVILTEKLAKSMGVGVGDTFTLYDQDDIGNPVGDGYGLTVTGIAENYVGNRLYMGSHVYERIYGSAPAFTSVYGTCTDDAGERATFTDDLHGQDSVETVAYNDETIDSYRKMLSSVNMIVVVLVTAAAALAFIVLYNLTNININERRREIASLKVLGFTTREVDAYIYREIILLTVLGALLGLVLGVFMEGFVVVTAEVDYVMFGRDIHLLSFIGAFVLTLAFSLLVMLAMRGKLKKIDMVESLKSIE